MITPELQNKIDRAIKLLRSVQAIAPEEVIQVSYSGGKDSDVILQLSKEAGINYRAVYFNTTIDPPGTIKHAQDAGAIIVRPEQNFFQLIAQKGYPSRIRRFCCESLKERRYGDEKKVILGIRRLESTKRAKRYTEPTVCRGTKKNPLEYIYPILDWENEDVLAFVLDRGIKLAPIYYEGGVINIKNRLGCMGCPLISAKRRRAFFQENPKWLRAWIKAGHKYLQTHPESAIHRNGDVYAWMLRELFFTRQKDWDEYKNSMFGPHDFKRELEKYFNIDLTI